MDPVQRLGERCTCLIYAITVLPRKSYGPGYYVDLGAGHLLTSSQNYQIMEGG